VVLDASSVLAPDSSPEKGVRYIILNTLAEVIDEFWVPGTFQQRNSGNLLAAGFKDGSFSVWSLPRLKLIKSTPYLSGRVSSILLDAPRRRVYLGGLGRVAGVSIENDWTQMLRGHNNFVSSMALSIDGQLLMTSGDDEPLRFWDIEEARLLQSFKFRSGWLSSIAIDDQQGVLTF